MLPRPHPPRLALAALLAFAAACGAQALPPRTLVPALDPASGRVAATEVELPGTELAAIRGPAGTFVVGGQLDSAGRTALGAAPDCAFTRTEGGVLAPLGSRCELWLGSYAALESARSFLLSAGAESLPPPLVLVEPRGDAQAPGLRYLPLSDVLVLWPGPSGARLPGALNRGIAVRELASRQLRPVLPTRPDEAQAIAAFLGAVAAGDPGYLAASTRGGDPFGQLDLSRPLQTGTPRAAQLAGALWAWADATEPLAAARAAVAAGRALTDRGAAEVDLLSLVAAQLNGTQRDQACAIFRARSAFAIAACP